MNINETWLRNYNLCCNYYKNNGNLRIPYNYIENDIRLGLWLYRQRKKYKQHKLNEKEVSLLNNLEILWDTYDSDWVFMYEKAKEYKETNGNLLVPARHRTEDGYDLGCWIGTQRKGYLNQGKHKLSEERKNLLEDIEMVWDVNLSQWLLYFDEAQKFYNQFGHLCIPVKYKTTSKLSLGKWLSHQRSIYKQCIDENNLSSIQERVEYLESIGMDWNTNIQKNTSFGEQVLYYYLSKCFEDIQNRYNELGFELDIYIPSLKLGIEYDGFISHKDVKRDIMKQNNCKKQGIKLINIREYKCPKLDKGNYFVLKDSSIESLEKSFKYIVDFIEKEYGLLLHLDIDIARDAQLIMDMYIQISTYNWEKYFNICKTYYEDKGDLLIPVTYEVDGLKVGNWLRRQRQSYQLKNGMRLSSTEIERLESIGMAWNVNEYKWNLNFSLIEEIFKVHGEIPKNTIKQGIKLDVWWKEQLKKYPDNIDEIRKQKMRGLLECYGEN